MGTFLTNITLHGPTQAAAAAAVRALLPNCDCYVAPNRNGWITLYGDAFEGEDPTALLTAASELCQECESDGFASLVHDSDVLAIWVFDREGELAMEYNSCPEYFGSDAPAETASTADFARALAEMSDGQTAAAAISAVLEKDNAFAEDTLDTLGETLGAPNLGVGYSILQEDVDNNAEIVTDWEQFLHVEPS